MNLNLPLATKFDDAVLFGSYLVQPKIDGVRMAATSINGQIYLFTRQGNQISNCCHIKEELTGVLKDGHVLDGELFYKDFQTTLSDFKKDGSNLSFICFDYWNEETKLKPYKSRYNALEHLIEGLTHIQLIPMLQAKIKPFEAHKYLEHFVSLGYEGLILRKDEMWQGGRTDSIIKLKNFFDEEFICQRVEQTEKSFVAYFETHDGKTFSTKASAQFYKSRKKYLGKPCSIRFQEYTNRGVPRFPILTTCRNYE